MGTSRTRHIPLAEAGARVADVMLAGPDTLAPDATVADARAVFASPRQKLLLVADGERYVGALRPASVEGLDGGVALGDVAPADVATVAPEDPTSAALALGEGRIPVVSGAGELVGLVCLNRTRESFCV